MKYILWAQNENPTIKNTIVIDGKIYTIGIDPIAMDAFDVLTKAGQNMKVTDKNIERLMNGRNSKYHSIADQLNYAINGNDIYMQSCYEDKDESGRRMPFMFVAKDESNVDEAINKLLTYSKQLNRTCKECEIDFLRKGISKSKKKSGRYFKVISLILIVLAILIALYLWKN